jgi:2'-5' RNA ligase superfamily
MNLMAIGLALLLPQEVRANAIALSASLSSKGAHGLRLDELNRPHITLSQHFVGADEIDRVFERVHERLRGRAPLVVQVTGGGHSTHMVWMNIERSPELVDLHEQLMDGLRRLEREIGGPDAFVDGDARLRDVLWVSGFRFKSSFGDYRPHVTLAEGTQPPLIGPFSFEASAVAVCHLGRFCTCPRVLRVWELNAEASHSDL